MTQPDPRNPSTYPRRVLLAVAGLSPAIVTETLYALAVQQEPAFIPTEIHVITTAQGKAKVTRALLPHPGADWVRRLCEEYDLKRIDFDEACIYQLLGTDGQPLSDITDLQANTCTADQIIAKVREFTEKDTCALHVSLAGGRKTMGYYAGYALSLLGRPQDRLSHVLVSEPYDKSDDFFYPSVEQRFVRTPNAELRDAHDAKVMLAEIPFVRMRQIAPVDLRGGASSFASTVSLAARLIAPRRLHMDYQNRMLQVGEDEVQVVLDAISFSFLAVYAERAKANLPPLGNRLRRDVEAFGKAFLTHYKECAEKTHKGTLHIHEDPTQIPERSARRNEYHSNFKDKLRKALGPTGWEAYDIAASGLTPNKSYALILSPDQISFTLPPLHMRNT